MMGKTTGIKQQGDGQKKRLQWQGDEQYNRHQMAG